jgi:hypothetical protein
LVGVGHISRSKTWRPSSPFVGTFVMSPVSFQSREVGVPHISRFTARPSSFPLGPGLRACPSFGNPCGVGHRFRCPAHFCIDGAIMFAFAVGVGNKPDPVAAVRGANGTSRNAVPLRVIPARGQVSENSLHSSSKES